MEYEVRRLRLEKRTLKFPLCSPKRNLFGISIKILETDLNNKLKSKSLDVEHDNEKISNVQVSLEELQRRNCEKDDEIAELTKKVTEMEDALGKKNDWLGHLTLELDSSRKSMVTQWRRCTSDRKGSVSVSRMEILRKEAASQCPLQRKNSDKGGRDVICLDETLKLFSSSFKVPKLKASVVR